MRITNALCRFVLPFLADYVDSGHRNTRNRVLDSLRSNIRYQLIVFACGAVVLVYYVFNHGFHGPSVKGTAIALAYAWGLILAIYLMGHGLVAIPRRMFLNASTSARLRRLQTCAPSVHEKMQDAIDDYDALEVQVMELRRRKTGTALDFQDWIEELVSTSNLSESRVSHSPLARVVQSTVPHVITERYLADLTRKLMRAQHKRIRFIEEWSHLVNEAYDLQKIIDASGSKRLDFERTHGPSWFSPSTILTPYTRYVLYANILPALRLLFSFFLALASVCIVWSEIFKRAIPSIAIVGLSIIHHPKATDRGKIGFAGQLMAGAWLCYMCAAALMSIREVKVWGNRALVRRHTYAESACWYATQVAKLTVPLSYNFITFLPKGIYEQTAFHRFLGNLINFTPLGSAFSAFFPIFILIPVLASLFNLYGRIKRVFGFGFLDDETEDNPSGFGRGGWREGQALIERERVGATGVGLSDQHTSPDQLSSSNFSPYSDSPSEMNPASQHVGSARVHVASPTRRAVVGGASSSGGAQNSSLQMRSPATNNDNDEEESSFFQGFAHRVRNTFDTANKPDFKINFTKPKWLTNDGDAARSGRDRQGPLDRLFGGRGLKL